MIAHNLAIQFLITKVSPIFMTGCRTLQNNNPCKMFWCPNHWHAALFGKLGCEVTTGKWVLSPSFLIWGVKENCVWEGLLCIWLIFKGSCIKYTFSISSCINVSSNMFRESYHETKYEWCQWVTNAMVCNHFGKTLIFFLFIFSPGWIWTRCKCKGRRVLCDEMNWMLYRSLVIFIRLSHHGNSRHAHPTAWTSIVPKQHCLWAVFATGGAIMEGIKPFAAVSLSWQLQLGSWVEGPWQ